MIPPLMSSTMSGEDVLGRLNQADSSKTQKTTEGTENQTGGRPEKADSEKSDKTLANKESMG